MDRCDNIHSIWYISDDVPEVPEVCHRDILHTDWSVDYHRIIALILCLEEKPAVLAGFGKLQNSVFSLEFLSMQDKDYL